MHDVVIVGAGAAGCVLASRLTEDPDVSVLLIEAGPRSRKLEVKIPAAFSKLYRTELDWGDSTTPQSGLDGREIVFPRGRMVGGSAAMNAMMVLRGHRADYDAWARGCHGWAWNDVEPAFARSAASSFPLADLRSGTSSPRRSSTRPRSPASLTHDLNAEDNGSRLRTRVAAARTALQRRRGLPRPGTAATESHRGDRCARHPRPPGGRACSRVAYRLHGEEVEEEALAEREVVLCAGAIGSPHTATVRNRPACTARGRRDRRCARVARSGSEPARPPGQRPVRQDEGVETLATAESLRISSTGRSRPGPLSSNLGEAVAFVRTKADLPAPDLELLLAPVLFEDEGLTQPTEHGLTLAVVLLRPRSVGTVTIRSADPEVLPAVDPRYLSDPGGEDMATLCTACGWRVASLHRNRSRASSRKSCSRASTLVRTMTFAPMCERSRRRSITLREPAAWGRTRRRSSIRSCVSAASSVFALRTPRSCPRSRAATRIGRR